MSNTAEAQPRPRKEEILDVATCLFAERGYEGTSMNDVAERVGMRKASLFYHFATKDALYEAVLDRLVASLQTALDAVYTSSGTYPDRLDAVTETMVNVLGSHPYAARLLLREAMDWGPVIRGKLLDRITSVLEAGAAWVRAGQEQGAFYDGDPKQMVLTAMSMHFLPFALGKLVEHYVGKDPFDASFVAERREALKVHTRNLQLKKRG
ncbi:MAG TPA: TetR/AcrR family transcriptional regulator [Polyangiaceae bacterium]|jgi:AcrR family transcriptional regulator